MDQKIKLTSFVKSAGWAAKLAPSELLHITSSLKNDDKNLLVGVESSDDASVYKIGEDKALVQTVDFITPIVDDPFVYGQIAAANSLSDVFAMGAEVLNALNIVGYDSCNLTKEILNEILAGGSSKVEECGGVVVGGHTIETPEMYYGLSVTGLVHPNKIWRNNTPKIGDVLILTKPLGSGILSTAIKADMALKEEIDELSFFLARLNQKATKSLKDFKVNSCTDITGFGLLGHAKEMAGDSFTLVFENLHVIFLQSALKYASIGLIPSGSYKNLEFIKNEITCKNEINPLLYDAQTSGGLLVSLDEKDAQKALKMIQENGDERASIVGYVKKRENKPLEIVWNMVWYYLWC